MPGSVASGTPVHYILRETGTGQQVTQLHGRYDDDYDYITYFIKSLPHVSVCHAPSSGRTLYYLLKNYLLFTVCCCSRDLPKCVLNISCT